MSDDLDSGSFNKNYKILKETADWLSGQKEPDIDQLVPKVEKAMKAYKICKDRLDAVQTTLAQYFEPASTGTEDHPHSHANGEGTPHSPRRRQPRPSNPPNEDDVDAPF